MEKADKRSSILEAAEKLFSELGYEGASTRQIAKEAGANMAMINYYFGSKEGVFMEIMTQRITDFKHQLNEIKEMQVSIMEKLLLVIERYATRILCNITFHKMMQRELSLPQRPEMFITIKNAMMENMLVLENIITEGIEDGTFRKVDVRMLIATVMGTISNVVIAPSKITYGTTLNINISKDRKLISERLITHLKDMITIYLTPIK
ncbi:MAG: TetR/AcrR family transcriptional regulator [Pedobacter sp.]|nr:MAG: TetR/AcrR family transcriptional regulator [Pedobacter sp.]